MSRRTDGPELLRLPALAIFPLCRPFILLTKQRARGGLSWASQVRAETRTACGSLPKNLHRGKAWMRTCSPYVALPFDPGRLRPELVGLLLHPVSRSETWRRLGTRRTLLRTPRGFHSKHAGPISLRRAEKLPPQSLSRRVPDCLDGPICTKPNTDKLLTYCT